MDKASWAKFCLDDLMRVRIEEALQRGDVATCIGSIVDAVCTLEVASDQKMKGLTRWHVHFAFVSATCVSCAQQSAPCSALGHRSLHPTSHRPSPFHHPSSCRNTPPFIPTSITHSPTPISESNREQLQQLKQQHDCVSWSQPATFCTVNMPLPDSRFNPYPWTVR